MLGVALFASALGAGSGASCAAGNTLSTTSTSSGGGGGASSSTTSVGNGGASSSSSGSGGASPAGSGGASSSSTGLGGTSSASGSGTGGATSTSSTVTASTSGTGGASSSSSSTSSSGAGGGDAGTAAGVLVMLAGGGATVLAGEYHPASGWTTSTLADATGDGPALALTSSTSAVGILRSTSDGGELRSTSWSPGSWSTFTALGAGVTTRITPAIAAAGTTADAVFQGDDFHHYFAAHQATWSPLAEPVGGTASPSYGPSPAAITALGADAVLAFAGNDGDLYDQARTAGAWLPAHAHALGNVLALSPSIIAPTAGPDLMVVFVGTDTHILSTTRTAGTWTTPVQLDVNALSGDPVSLAALPGGRAVVAYRGTDSKLYFSRFDPTATPTWSVPAAVFTPNVTSPSTPALAPGLTGADAELVYIDGGLAKHTRLSGTAWSSPVTIGGAGLTHAAVSGLAM